MYLALKNPGGIVASDNWEAGKPTSSLTLGDLAPGFLGSSCMRFAGFASNGRRPCQGLELNLSARG